MFRLCHVSVIDTRIFGVSMLLSLFVLHLSLESRFLSILLCSSAHVIFPDKGQSVREQIFMWRQLFALSQVRVSTSAARIFENGFWVDGHAMMPCFCLVIFSFSNNLCLVIFIGNRMLSSVWVRGAHCRVIMFHCSLMVGTDSGLYSTDGTQWGSLVLLNY